MKFYTSEVLSSLTLTWDFTRNKIKQSLPHFFGLWEAHPTFLPHEASSSKEQRNLWLPETYILCYITNHNDTLLWEIDMHQDLMWQWYSQKVSGRGVYGPWKCLPQRPILIFSFHFQCTAKDVIYCKSMNNIYIYFKYRKTLGFTHTTKWVKLWQKKIKKLLPFDKGIVCNIEYRIFKSKISV